MQHIWRSTPNRGPDSRRSEEPVVQKVERFGGYRTHKQQEGSGRSKCYELPCINLQQRRSASTPKLENPNSRQKEAASYKICNPEEYAKETCKSEVEPGSWRPDDKVLPHLRHQGATPTPKLQSPNQNPKPLSTPSKDRQTPRERRDWPIQISDLQRIREFKPSKGRQTPKERGDHTEIK